MVIVSSWVFSFSHSCVSNIISSCFDAKPKCFLQCDANNIFLIIFLLVQAFCLLGRIKTFEQCGFQAFVLYGTYWLLMLAETPMSRDPIQVLVGVSVAGRHSHTTPDTIAAYDIWVCVSSKSDDSHDFLMWENFCLDVHCDDCVVDSRLFTASFNHRSRCCFLY